jgi:hypothetical protein
LWFRSARDAFEGGRRTLEEMLPRTLQGNGGELGTVEKEAGEAVKKNVKWWVLAGYLAAATLGLIAALVATR